MYILNHKVIINQKFKCRKAVANYLINNGVPLLSREDDLYYFADTDLLKNTLENAPLWIKLFCV